MVRLLNYAPVHVRNWCTSVYDRTLHTLHFSLIMNADVMLGATDSSCQEKSKIVKCKQSDPDITRPDYHHVF